MQKLARNLLIRHFFKMLVVGSCSTDGGAYEEDWHGIASGLSVGSTYLGLSKRKELWALFIDLVKAFDSVPREALFAVLRELELELIQTQMAQKPMLRAEVYAHAMRASQNRKKEVRREKKV